MQIVSNNVSLSVVSSLSRIFRNEVIFPPIIIRNFPQPNNHLAKYCHKNMLTVM